MYLNPTTEAEKIKKTYWRNKGRSSPVDPVNIAKSSGIQVCAIDFPSNISPTTNFTSL